MLFPDEITTQSDLCFEAKKIIIRNGDVTVTKDGECTALYWHLAECEECSELRFERSK